MLDVKASNIAREYDGGGYNDWFLPCANELSIMCINLGLAPTDHLYWSSCEDSPYPYSRFWANRMYCYCCCGNFESKLDALLVRAARAF